MTHTNEEILRRFNEAIANLPHDLVPAASAQHPIVFICGAPRSGTTLLYQTLAYVGDVGYVNNLVARFYANPPVGAWLSEQAEIEPVFHPYSEYGRTRGASSPHEFGRFWLDAFGLDTIGEPDSPIDTETVATAAQRVRELARVFSRPFVTKSFDYLWSIRALAEALPESRWIHITRDHSDNVESLIALYLDRSENGQTPRWTSATLRSTREAHADSSLNDRAAAQVSDLNRHIADELTGLPGARTYSLTLDDLTDRSEDTVAALFDHFGIAWSQRRARVAADAIEKSAGDQ